ncbi:MAG: TlpA disulfide reductase family protein [Halieaceae bacterium]
MRALSCALLLFCVSLFSAAPWAGDKAPAFVLADSDGMLISLSDYRGSPLVLHFWATWCPYCKKLQPGLEALQAAHADEGLVLLGISFREDRGAEPQQVLKSRGLHFKTLLEGEDVAALYGVRGTPTTFFIDRQGRVLGMSNTSDPDDPVLEDYVGMILVAE